MVVIVGLAAVTAAGCVDRSESQPLVLDGVDGHRAAVISEPGTYTLRERQLASPGALVSLQLQLSADICDYARITVDGPVERQVSGTDFVTPTATLKVSELRRPVVVGYAIGYTRLGPPVTGLNNNRVRCL